MTEYFEVLARDGPARLGELRLSDPLVTPAPVDDRLHDAGSLWVTEREPPTGDPNRLTVLPHRAFPRGTPAEVVDAFDTPSAPLDAPTATVVSPETARDHGSDASVLGGAPGYAGHAAAMLEAIVAVRTATPPDTALYLPGVATPANVATLVAAGVDLVDADRAVVRGHEGFYLSTDGEHFLEDLAELPCACAACRGGRDGFDRADCATHNATALRAELARVRERIRAGQLRQYVEGQARHEAWLTGLMRRLDRRYGYVEERTPVVRRAQLLAATEESMRRAEIQRFAERVTTRYRCRFDGPLVLVPCSATKPYSESPSHRQFRGAIGYRAHQVSITSPIGVVPQELELTYPAQHYDAVVTGEWTAGEIEFVADILTSYLARTDYDRHLAHVPADYRPICERVSDETGISFEYTVEGHPTDQAALDRLDAALEGESTYSRREREHRTINAIADYQFGAGAGDDLFAELETRSRYPRLRVYGSEPEADGSDHQLATLVAQYGTLAFTLAGARRWLASDVPVLGVDIDAFVPQGSVLAPGVQDATAAIRTGDEVVVTGPEAVAVGRAEMSGPEMAESTRGVAVDVRHAEPR